MCWQCPNWRRPLGWPRTTWMKYIYGDLDMGVSQRGQQMLWSFCAEAVTLVCVSVCSWSKSWHWERRSERIAWRGLVWVSWVSSLAFWLGSPGANTRGTSWSPSRILSDTARLSPCLDITYLLNRCPVSPSPCVCYSFVDRLMITTLIYLSNGPFTGTTQASQYQRGKTNLDFTEARDNEWQWHQLGYMQVCISHQTDNHTTQFLQAGCPWCCPTNSVKALLMIHNIIYTTVKSSSVQLFNWNSDWVSIAVSFKK